MSNLTIVDEREIGRRNFMNIQAGTQTSPVFRATAQNLVPL
jgi:hypothetical protein